MTTFLIILAEVTALWLIFGAIEAWRLKRIRG
jgi:hypothetical protein